MSQIFSFKTLVVAAVILGLFVAFAGSAFAQTGNGNTRPGWGFGDKNHIHVGPPGQSVFPHNPDFWRERLEQRKQRIQAFVNFLRSLFGRNA